MFNQHHQYQTMGSQLPAQQQHKMAGMPTQFGAVAPQFPQQLTVPQPAGQPIPQMPGMPVAPVTPGLTPEGMLPLEQSYIENILRFNRGKMATVYQTFEFNPEWPSRIFRGIVEEAGRDHIILSDPETGRNYLLLMVNLDYVEFDEPIEYIPPVLPGFVGA